MEGPFVFCEYLPALQFVDGGILGIVEAGSEGGAAAMGFYIPTLLKCSVEE